ncbi:hypothetical protein BH11CYA1_BH11CYA1_06080 [soil metagenome]
MKKNNISFGDKVNVSYENKTQNGPPSAVFVFFFFVAFIVLAFALIAQMQTTNRQTEELSTADKAFLGGNYAIAEVDYNSLLTDLHGSHTTSKESFTYEKLALAQIAQRNYDAAEKNLDAALEMHLRFIDNGPDTRGSRLPSSESNSERETKHVLRVLSNQSQLYYLENKKEMVPALVSQAWDKVLEKRQIQRREHRIFRVLGQTQVSNLEKRHLESQAAALQTQLNDIKALPEGERLARYIAVLKEQRPPDNAQFSNCDFGVFSSQ